MPTSNTNTAASKKPTTAGSQNPSANNVSADDWKTFMDTHSTAAAGSRYTARAAENDDDNDDDDDDDEMTEVQEKAARRSAQKSSKRNPSGPSVSK
jgi:hypothetical protein